MLIMVYGSWGSETYSSENTLDEALIKAQQASAKDPKNEYCVGLGPGDWSNPLFKNGEQISGLTDRTELQQLFDASEKDYADFVEGMT